MARGNATPGRVRPPGHSGTIPDTKPRAQRGRVRLIPAMADEPNPPEKARPGAASRHPLGPPAAASAGSRGIQGAGPKHAARRRRLRCALPLRPHHPGARKLSPRRRQPRCRASHRRVQPARGAALPKSAPVGAASSGPLAPVPAVASELSAMARAVVIETRSIPALSGWSRPSGGSETVGRTDGLRHGQRRRQDHRRHRPVPAAGPAGRPGGAVQGPEHGPQLRRHPEPATRSAGPRPPRPRRPGSRPRWP